MRLAKNRMSVQTRYVRYRGLTIHRTESDPIKGTIWKVKIYITGKSKSCDDQYNFEYSEFQPS